MELKPKIKLYDKELGTRELDPTNRLALIEDQYELLKAYRDDGRKASQRLLDDIAVYEHILSSEDPDRFADEYVEKMSELRFKQGPFIPTKMDAARELGWKVNRGD